METLTIKNAGPFTERRIAAIRVSPEVFGQGVDDGDRVILCTDNDLPKDAMIVGMAFDPGYAAYSVYIASKEYEPLSLGYEAPFLTAPTFTSYDPCVIDKHGDSYTVDLLRDWLYKVQEITATGSTLNLEGFVIWPQSHRLPMPRSNKEASNASAS